MLFRKEDIMDKREKETKRRLLNEYHNLLTLERECYESGDMDGANLYQELAKEQLRQYEAIKSKMDPLKIVELSISAVTAVGAIAVPILVCKTNNKAMTNNILTCWQAQMTGEVPAKLTDKIISEAIKNKK